MRGPNVTVLTEQVTGWLLVSPPMVESFMHIVLVIMNLVHFLKTILCFKWSS